MEEALELARAKDTKERMAGVERLHQLLEASRKSLTSAEVTSLVDCCLDLLKDNNFKVSQGALQSLASAAVLSGEHFKLHFNALVPAVVERLGDAKQPVRDAARRLLLTLMEVILYFQLNLLLFKGKKNSYFFFCLMAFTTLISLIITLISVIFGLNGTIDGKQAL